jgi:hypothetical protein
MASSAASAAASTSTVTVNVFDGTREPFSVTPKKKILYTIVVGRQKIRFKQEMATNSLRATNLPFYNDDDGDRYTALVFANGYQQAGFVPVKLSPSVPGTVDLMLIPKEPQLNFADAKWKTISAEYPFLAAGVDDATAKTRYGYLMEDKPKSLASLLNLTTAMSQIFLREGTPNDYLKQVIWDMTLAEDRFFAWCDAKLIDEVRLAASHKEFEPEAAPWLFHPGASESWKQVRFGEANVQLTFHEDEKQKIGGVDCIVVEPDIDYYKDPAAHGLFEVLPNKLTGGLSNPEFIYVLRWIAGRHAGLPEFNPPYTIV